MAEHRAKTRYWTIQTALRLFDTERHVAFGVWPDDLANRTARRTNGAALPSTGLAAEVLDALVSAGAVERRPSGLYESTDGLLRWLDRSAHRLS